MTVNGELVFCRDDELTVENLKEIKPYITDTLYNKTDGLVEIAKNSLNQE